VGDKLTGRHGDKGVISKVLPVEDMPYMEDGTPIDIILSPLGIVKRMNLGQLKECSMGMYAKKLGMNIKVPAMTEVDENKIYDLCEKNNIDAFEKVTLFDGRTGEAFDKDVAVGYRYILKLNHLADDKVHARSTGPYTMEVWALEAHAAPSVLHEMLTIKSDDVIGRALAYKSIINGTEIDAPNIPESFKVLTAELRSLGLNLEMGGMQENKRDLEEEVESGGIAIVDSSPKEEVLEEQKEASSEVEKSEGMEIIDMDDNKKE
jgi:DNA-directed RNA polymerase subunit beta